MGDDEFHLRHILAQESAGLVDVLDARTDIKALAAAITFAQQRFAHHQRIEGHDEGAHRQPVDRRRGDERSSRTPVSASCKVRGIGVAVSVSTCTSARSSFSRSLCLTPKCCSSSMMRRPRSLKAI